MRTVKKEFESLFEKYRLYNYLTGEGSNADLEEITNMKLFCEKIESIVETLPFKEKFLITERYLSNEADYINDMFVYKERFDPPIAGSTYIKIRNRAFDKLSLELDSVRRD